MSIIDDDVLEVFAEICEGLPSVEEQQAAVSAIEDLQDMYELSEQQACDFVLGGIFNPIPKDKLH